MQEGEEIGHIPGQRGCGVRPLGWRSPEVSKRGTKVFLLGAFKFLFPPLFSRLEASGAEAVRELSSFESCDERYKKAVFLISGPVAGLKKDILREIVQNSCLEYCQVCIFFPVTIAFQSIAHYFLMNR